MAASLVSQSKRLGAALALNALTALGYAQIFSIEIPPRPPATVSNVVVAHGDDWHWRRGTNAP